ncbi:MAG: Hpt domain-containing protein, partial [Planctomycetes bacterium]|nr:Hpt domain-containing protein [Planctomycetota bacterium]
MPDDPYKYFRVEARDLLEQIGCGVLDLERGARPAEAAPRLLRLAHTLKGAARVVRQHAIAEHAHALEDALAPLRDSSAAVPKETIDRLLAGVDAMQAGLKALAAPPPATPVATRPVASPAEEGAPPAPAEVDRRGTPSRARYEPAPPGPEAEDRTARADLADLDAILEGAAETRAHLATLRASLSDIDRARRLAGQIADQIAAPAAARGRSPAPAGVAASARQARAIAQELRALTGSAERAISGATGGLDRALRG